MTPGARNVAAAIQAGDHGVLVGELMRRHGRTLSRAHFEALHGTFSAMTALWPDFARPDLAAAAAAYARDAAERWALFLDTLRRQGNASLARESTGYTPVLAFDYDLVIDGRRLERPVNYALVRINPPAGLPPQREDGRPFVIIDPRAGHGSGIGGFKADSEVGVALEDGHPVYFVIFHPQPEPGQSLADVCAAEARFLEEVHARHPKAPAPLVIGNCQGGWATMILSATHPGLTGPLVIAGAPLSYWAGEIGKNPFRYFGGVAGGAVPALIASDMGASRFDGASLVFNFETLNPGRTWFRKYYDLFANVDRGAENFLGFEKWWSGFYFMNEAEIRWIVENLFIGNKLTRGQAVLDDGTSVDLTRIKAPIVVFASHGDNITPPQQALNWIADLYDSVEEIRARGHIIIYTLHDSVGHLGIFVSAKVATKQHREITSVVKTIESLAPGLYEMRIGEADEGYEVAFESRNIGDILALDDGRDEEAEFAAVAKLSEWGTRTYELTVRPVIRSLMTPEIAERLVEMHPIRQRSALFSDKNPMMAGVAARAQAARESRNPIDPANPFLRLERLQADLAETGWNMLRDWRDAAIEISFHALYNTPWMRVVAADAMASHVPHDIARFPEVRAALAHIEEGDYKVAIVRMLVLLARARGSVRRDRLERSNRILHARAPFDTMAPDKRSQIIYEQSLIVEFAPEAALETLPALLADEVDRMRAIDLVLEIAGPVEEMDGPTIAMFKRIQGGLRIMARDWHEPAPAAPAPAEG